MQMPEADDEDLGGGLLSLGALEERRREIEAQLRVIASSLRDAGAVSNGFDVAYFLTPPPPDYPSPDPRDRLFRRRVVPVDDEIWRRMSEMFFDFDPPDRTRIEWELTAFGREKCDELWRIFDLDGDRAWTYRDFLEYVTAIDGRDGVDTAEMWQYTRREEIWRMYMTDLVGLDGEHRLTFDGFLAYRELIEARSPLARELKALEICMEWQALQRYRRIVRVFREYADKDGIVPFRHLQFLVHECGLPTAYQDLWQAIQRQRHFHRCHLAILGQKKALRLFGYRQKTTFQPTNPAIEEAPRVCRAGVLALLWSAWMPADRTRWRKVVLTARLRMYTAIRKCRRTVEDLFSWIRRASKTGLLGTRQLQSTPEQERGDYVLKAEIGPAFTTHASIQLSYYSDADSAASLHELKYLEKGAECFIYFDFLCQSGTRDTDAHWLCQRLNWFIDLFLREHLELLPFYFKSFVSIPTKMQLRAGGGNAGFTSAAGSAPVLRLVILFTKKMDLYEVMQSLNLPSSMQFDHILQRLTMRWLFSHSLEEILTNPRFVFGSQWSCRGQLDLRFNRQAVGQILRQAVLKMDDHVKLEKDVREFMRSERQKHSVNEKSTSVRGDAIKVTALDERTDNVMDEEDDNTEVEGIVKWRDRLRRLALVLGSARELSLTWSFSNLAEALTGSKWVRSVLKPTTLQFLKGLLSNAGALASEWKHIGESFRGEFSKSRFVVTTAAAAATASSSSVPVTRMFSRVTSRSSLQGVDEVLGLHGSIASAFPFASPLGTPQVPSFPGISRHGMGLSRNSSTTELPSADQVFANDDPLEFDLLELYEACAKNLLSLHSFRAEAGTTGLMGSFEGWNIFSALPRVVPMSAARKASLVRTRSTMSTDGSTTGAGFTARSSARRGIE